MHALESLLESVAERAVAKALEALPRAAPDRPPLKNQAELAQHLGCDVRTVFALRKKGCPHVFVGDSPRFDLDEVMVWLKEQGSKRAP